MRQIRTDDSASPAAGIILAERRPFAVRAATALSSVSWNDGFWKERHHRVRSITLPWLWERMMNPQYGAVPRNFQIFAGKSDAEFVGSYWSEELIHKWIEAASYHLAYDFDAELDRRIDEAIAIVADAQMDDGYVVASSVLHGTRFLVPRYHELYNLGHLITAACVHHTLTGKRNYLNVAIRAADLLYDTFVPNRDRFANFSNTKSYIMAVFDLARVTGDARYAELGNVFIDLHGAKSAQSPPAGAAAAAGGGSPARDAGDAIGMADRPAATDQAAAVLERLGGRALSKFEHDGVLELQGTDLRQSRVPLREESTVVGHAVNFSYLYAGATDAYLEGGDARLREALERLWDDLTLRKMYVNGGVCPVQNGMSLRGDRVGEAAGPPYELPNDTAYNETCAQIGTLMWAWRMLLVTGDAKYADAMEHELYNGTISSIGEDSVSWFYMNPLRWYGEHHDLRTKKHHHNRYQPCGDEGFGHTCCPTNLTRLESQFHGYLYTTDAEGICVDHYGANSYRGEHERFGSIELVQRTDYPWDGTVTITVERMDPSCALKLRIPGWVHDASVTVNGAPQPIDLVPGSYATLRRQWKPGDSVVLTLPMPVRYLAAHPKVEAARNAVALLRGPLLYCLESPDLPDGIDVAALRLPRDPDFEPARSDLFGGITVLHGTLRTVESLPYDGPLYGEWRPSPPTDVEVDLIPYYLWANRGVSSMEVWLPLL
jgi:uncharacterized protein